MARNLPAAQPRRTEQGERQGVLQGVCALLPPDSLILGAGGFYRDRAILRAPQGAGTSSIGWCGDTIPVLLGGCVLGGGMATDTPLWRTQATLVSHPAVPDQPSHAPTSLQGEFPSTFDVTSRLL